MLLSNLHDLFNILFFASWFLTAVAVICNAVALIYITARRREQMRHRRLKLDEIVLLSLCSFNLINSVLTSLDCALMVVDSRKPLPALLFVITGHGIGFSLFVSLANVLVFAMERLVSFRFPFFHRDLKRRFLLMVLVACCILSAAPTTQLYYRRNIYFLTLCSLLVFSNIFLIFAYLYIFAIIKRTIRSCTIAVVPSKSKSYYTFTKKKSRMQVKTTIMCLSIVISYFFCTVPPAIWMIIHKGQGVTHRYSSPAVMTMYMLIILRTVFDPLVYILRNKIFNFSMIILSRVRLHLKETSASRKNSIRSTNNDYPDRNQLNIPPVNEGPYVLPISKESKM